MFSTTCFVLLFLEEQRMFWNIAMSLWNIPTVPLHLLKVSLKLLLALLLWRGHITVHCMLAFSILPSVVWILWFCEQSNPQFRILERKEKKIRIKRTMGSSSYFKKSKNLHKFHERTGKERSTGYWTVLSLLFYFFVSVNGSSSQRLDYW